jgi:hypothetical protein
MIWQYLASIPHLIFSPRSSPPMPLSLSAEERAEIGFQRDPVPGDVFEHEVRDAAPAPRLSFHSGSGLFGYPSTGGVWILENPHPVLLQHLSIDRFAAVDSQRESDPVAEDAFCDSLKKVGARWWRSFFAADFQEGRDPSIPKPDYIYTGWPKNGGVWFLQLNQTEYYLSRVGMLAMALDMDEYCKVLETIGATFYEDPKDCDYLKDLV